MKNSKGFSLVEVLAVIVILGIFTTVAIIAYSRYKENAVKQSYETMAKDAASAAEEYFMDYINNDEVSIEDLVRYEYLSDTKDPANKDSTCTGRVIRAFIISNDEDKLNTSEFTVVLECSNKKICRKYPGGKEVNC